MKTIATIVLIAASTFAVAQTNKPVALTPEEKKDVDLAQTKIENINLSYRDMQNQYQQAIAQLGAKFKEQSEALNKLLAADRKAHNLPDDANFNPTAFEFTLPEKKEAAPPATAAPAPAAKPK